MQRRALLALALPPLHSSPPPTPPHALAQVCNCYPADTAGFGGELMQLLERHHAVLEPALRQSLVRALILLRNRHQLAPTALLPLLFRLFRVQDKALRQLLFRHITSDIKNSNKKQRNDRLNRAVQNFMYRCGRGAGGGGVGVGVGGVCGGDGWMVGGRDSARRWALRTMGCAPLHGAAPPDAVALNSRAYNHSPALLPPPPAPLSHRPRSVIQDEHEGAAKKGLAVLTEMWRRRVWRDARTVNVIAAAAQHRSSRIMLAALKFFLGQDAADAAAGAKGDDGAASGWMCRGWGWGAGGCGRLMTSRGAGRGLRKMHQLCGAAAAQPWFPPPLPLPPCPSAPLPAPQTATATTTREARAR